MSNVSTFGTFTMARLGIYAAHKALDITGNNISNINTKDYARQSIDQVSLNMGAADRNQSMMDTRVGSGVFVLGVTQMRDQFLDIRYRTEMTNVGAMEAKDSGLTEIKRIIDEVGKGEDGEGVLEARFNDMIQMMENLVTKGAGKDEFDTLFRSACSATVDTIHAYANALSVAESNLRDLFDQTVAPVNTSLQRIQELNVGIRKAQVYGGNALILQDERNILVDELSKYFNVDVSIEKEDLGEKVQVDKLVIKTSDIPPRTLVDGIFVGQIAIRQEDIDGEMVDSPTLQLDLTALKDPNGRAITHLTDLDNELKDTGKAAEGTAKYTSRADAKKVADTMNEDNPAEDGGEYRVVAVTNKDIGTTYEVHLFSRERTMASKNGESVDEEFYEITSDEAAAKKAAEDAMAAYKEEHPAEEGTEYRVVRTSKEVDVTDTDGNPVTDTDGNPEKKTVYGYEVRLFEPATYKTEEEAKTALEALQKSIQDGDTNYTTAETLDDGSKVHYEYRIAKGLEDPPNFEIHKFQIFSGEVEFGDQELRGSFQEQREILVKSGIFSTYEELHDYDAAAASKRGIPYYRKTLDVLANSFATLMNKLNLDAFKAANPNWEADKLTLPVLFSNDGTTDATDEPLIDASNISISKSWANGSFKVQTTNGNSELTQSTATDNVARMLSLLQNDVRFTPQGAMVQNGAGNWELVEGSGINEDAFSKDVFFTGTFQELFTNHMNGNLGRDMNMTKTMLKSYETVAEDLYVSRDGVMGVDLNDEAMNMMMYEKSYSAACRLMTVYDGMLDKLINGTAV